MVELTHNGERYMVDGGKWYRRLDPHELWNTWTGYQGMNKNYEWKDSKDPEFADSRPYQYRAACTDPRPPFVVGQRVKVARKDETCGYWVEDMDDLVGQSGEVFRYTAEFNGQEVPSVKFDDGDYWNFPPWCLDAVSDQKEQAQ